MGCFKVQIADAVAIGDKRRLGAGRVLALACSRACRAETIACQKLQLILRGQQVCAVAQSCLLSLGAKRCL
jgi:hypothetical protein